MHAEPQKEHGWLKQLVGEWTYETECDGGPGNPPLKTTGSETVRALGDLWIVGDGQGEMPGGGAATMQITLGFDPAKGRFVGSWIGSMMHHFWVYDGFLDESGTVLTLEAEGPSFAGDGGMATYRDIITIKSPDHRILTGNLRNADGSWTSFMTSHDRRKG
jgi:hypothetical protein